jgi:hypothetical protein
MNTRGLRRIHLYLGTLCAPILLLFAASGGWQVYRFNDAKKDGSYTPPKIVKTLSAVHKNQTLDRETSKKTPLKALVFAASLTLITTTLLGIVMAYRFSGSPLTVTLCLLAGLLVPAVLLFLSR